MLPVTVLSSEQTSGIDQDVTATAATKAEEIEEGLPENDERDGRESAEDNEGEGTGESNIKQEKTDDAKGSGDGSVVDMTESGDATIESVAVCAEDEGNKDQKSGPTRKMGKILSIVYGMLKEADYKFYADPDRDIFRMTTTCRNASYNVVFDIKEDKEQLFVYVCCSNRVPEDRRLQVAEFITRSNFGMAMGNFEMDMNDGEMRYKVSIDVEDGELSCKMVQNMLAASIQTMERYFPGLMAVCYGGQDAAVAVAAIEGR